MVRGLAGRVPRRRGIDDDEPLFGASEDERGFEALAGEDRCGLDDARELHSVGRNEIGASADSGWIEPDRSHLTAGILPLHWRRVMLAGSAPYSLGAAWWLAGERGNRDQDIAR